MRQVLKACFKKNHLAKEILLQGVSEDDKKIGVFVFEPVFARHAALSVENKSKTIEEIHEALVVKQNK